MVVAVASLSFSAYSYTSTKETTEKNFKKQELTVKNQMARERLAANNQIRNSALMAGRTQLELIKARRRVMILAQKEYNAGNPFKGPGTVSPDPTSGGITGSNNSGNTPGGK